MTDKHVDFRSLEDLAGILEEMGLTVHRQNRIAGGESNAVWYLAEAIRSIGKLAAAIENDPQLRRLYGDAYQSGVLAEEARVDHFVGLLRDELLSGQ